MFLLLIILCRKRIETGPEYDPSGGPDGGGFNRAQQMIPCLEYDVNRDGAEMLEESVCWPARGHRFASGQHGEPCHGIEVESQEIEHHQHAGQGFLSMAEIMLQVVSVVFQDVERFILDLPARAATGGEVRRDLQIGDNTIEIRPFSLRVLDFDGEPIHRQRVIRVA